MMRLKLSQLKTKRKFAVIIGEEDGQDATIIEAVEFLHNQDCDVSINHITRKDEEIDHAIKLAGEEFDLIISVGGDGTLGNIVNGIMGCPNPQFGALGIVPFGTANDFAAAAGVPSNPIEAVKFILSSTPIEIDVARMNDHYFLNMASGGFGAEITATTPSVLKDWLGKFAYMVTGVARFQTLSTREAIIKAPDFEWQGELLAIGVGNSRQAGGGIEICPNAKINDGLLDLTIIPNVSIDSLPDLLADMLNLGDDPNLSEIVYQQVAWVEIATSEGLHMNLDGQPHCGTSFRMSLADRKLPLHIARDSILLTKHE